MPHKLSYALLSLSLFLLVGCQSNKPTTNQTNQIANPASTYCINQGGQLKIEKTPNQSEYGVCIFEDNRQCEEWAMFNKLCPIGGLKVTGFTTDAARYCAITGNKFTPGSGDSGTCTTIDGKKSCSIEEFYLNHCLNTSPIPDPTLIPKTDK